VDAVIISHNHYDHLDYQSIIDLNQKFADKGINWFVGLGLAEWFKSSGINENVHELDWWQSKKFKDLEFIFTPSQHWCARGIADR
jgi:N-acyl-phosphatidylethanolamine-hydrolysing phospholipase D